ncbi:sigma-70 family RNA polymerase sigma factor [Reichenbachiella sp. MALMAid0571]|uniref:RNA polymerase sigma factor n=1 Tax=Reichenbachiella sp. MALMAid0571 TaxID=3143939 RepID=UPI0032DEC385
MDDRILINQILSGDKVAFKKLVQNNERLVFHIVSKLVQNKSDVEDLCQDTFVKVYQKLSTFGYKSKLSTWIATIAYNTGINYLRSKKINTEWDGAETGVVIDVETPSSIIENKEIDQIVRKYVSQLPKQYQLIISLYHLDEFSYSEITEITQIPEGTVKSYLFRGRKILKEKLKVFYQNEVIK